MFNRFFAVKIIPMKTLKSLPRAFWILIIIGFIVRLIGAMLTPHPGIADPNHYFDLARNLADGRGFVIDYIWQYHNPPADLTHPIDYWMPLPAVYPALSMALFGKTLFVALIPSVIIGTLLMVLVYWICATVGLEQSTGLIAMASILFLPEFVLNSIRTDTTLSYVLYIGIACVAFYKGMGGQSRWLLITGICGGLAQLSRQDALIFAPAIILALIICWKVSDEPLNWRALWLIPLGWIGIMSPWLIRNYSLFGAILPAGASRTLFMTSFIDQFTYGRTLDLQHYLDWGIGNIVSNWVFQSLANVKMIYVLLDVGLPIFAFVGIGGLLYQRDKKRLLMLILPLSMVLGLFLFYSFVTPFHTQGGSFKKSYMLVIPFMAMAGAWMLTRYLSSRRIAYALTGVMLALMFMNTIDLLRGEFALLKSFDDSIIALSERLQELGDFNGDGEIVVMSQDPYIMDYHGYRGIMIPSDSREMILEAAYRYQVDYILLPSARESLDSLYDGTQTDPRLSRLEVEGRYELLAVVPPDA